MIVEIKSSTISDYCGLNPQADYEGDTYPIFKQSDSMIPWHHTDGTANVRTVLNAIYNHYSGDSVVNTYLRDHCLHLLEAPTGDTKIPCSYFDSSYLIKKLI